MAETTLVEPKIQAGAELLQAVDDELGRVFTAFWYRDLESDDWRLVLGSDAVDREGPTRANRRLLDVFREKEIALSPLEVDLVGRRDSLVEMLRSLKTQPIPLRAPLHIYRTLLRDGPGGALRLEWCGPVPVHAEHGRCRDRLGGVRRAAPSSELPPFVGFTRGIAADRDAVEAAFTQPWSTGPVEGHVHKIKLLKRAADKRQETVFHALKRLQAELPFRILGLDSDNGTEFINRSLLDYCTEHSITFTRSRPYLKNDTCHVEQKNWAVVRRLVGYDRLQSPALPALERIHDLAYDYVNFLHPETIIVAFRRTPCTLASKSADSIDLRFAG
jgi:hypothetical protein